MNFSAEPAFGYYRRWQCLGTLAAKRCPHTAFSNRTTSSTPQTSLTSKCSPGSGPKRKEVKSCRDRKLSPSAGFFFFFSPRSVHGIIVIEIITEFHSSRPGKRKCLALFVWKPRVIRSKYPSEKSRPLSLRGRHSSRGLQDMLSTRVGCPKSKAWGAGEGASLQGTGPAAPNTCPRCQALNAFPSSSPLTCL